MNIPAAQQHPDYLASLGLQRAPFLDQIDDRFFYADPQLVQRLDLLQHLIQFGDMLLGVCGPAGSGKSTLLPQLLRRGATTWRSCRINGGQIQQPLDLLTQLADGFGLDHGAAPERLKADLLRLFQTLRHTSLIPVVAVDDAHLLPDPALKTLLELGGEPRETLKLLRVVLFSAPGLEQRLIQAGWHSPLQPLLHNLDLPRFDDHQTAAYLMYRLAVAGYSGESPFSLTEIRALHKSADGLPGRLNVLAHETLVERAGRIAARRGMPDVKPGRGRRPMLVMGTATGVLILGALAGYLLTRPGEESAIEATALIESAPAPSPEPSRETAAESAPQSLPEAAATPETVAAPQTVAEATPPHTSPPASTETAKHEPPAATTPATGPAAIGQAPTPPASDSTPAAPAETPVPETGAPAGTVSQTPAEASEETTPAEAPAAANAELPGAQTAAAVPATQTEVSAPPAAGEGPDPSRAKPETGSVTPVAAPSEPRQNAESGPPPAAAEPAAAATAKPVRPQPLRLPEGVQQADWLLERPPSRFALQLLAVHQPDSLRGYLRDHAIPEPVAVFRTRLKGSDWYVLVQGDYPNMSAARAAIAELPAAVRRTKPWPRSFASIHTDIRKAAR